MSSENGSRANWQDQNLMPKFGSLPGNSVFLFLPIHMPSPISTGVALLSHHAQFTPVHIINTSYSPPPKRPISKR